MKINDTTNQFFNLYRANGKLTFNVLDEYYYKTNEIFKDYFLNHCTKTKDRIEDSINQYENDIQKLMLIADSLPGIIQEVFSCAVQYFGFEVNIEFNLFIGVYGSNAYAYSYSVFLAIEKLSSVREYLKIIVAHEIAHVYHNYFLLEKSKIDLESVPLMNGITGMYFEGVATYISKRLVPNLPEYVYYSYEDSGEDWYTFCCNNQKKIAKAFLEVSDWGIDDMREWFRLSGGRKFGHTRLGYFLGTTFIEDTIKELSEFKTFTLLADKSFLSVGNQWLDKISALS